MVTQLEPRRRAHLRLQRRGDDRHAATTAGAARARERAARAASSGSAAGEPGRELETARMRKDGRRIDVALTASPILDERGEVIGVSTIAPRHLRAEGGRAQARRERPPLRADQRPGRDLRLRRLLQALNGAWEQMLGWTRTSCCRTRSSRSSTPTTARRSRRRSRSSRGGETHRRVQDPRRAPATARWLLDRVVGVARPRRRALPLRRARDHGADARSSRRSPPSAASSPTPSRSPGSAAGSSTSATGERGPGRPSSTATTASIPSAAAAELEQVLERIHPDDRESRSRSGWRRSRPAALEFDYAYRVVLADGACARSRSRAARSSTPTADAADRAPAATSPPSATPSGSRTTSSASSRTSCARR